MIRGFNRSVNILLYITIVFMSSSIIGAEETQTEWHQWRGANRDGISLETDILKAWPETGPKELWRLPLGDGFSGISVANGRAVYHVCQGARMRLSCVLMPKQGRSFGGILTIGFTRSARAETDPRSTPTIDGDTVYVLSAFGRLVALNVNTGEELWNHDFTQRHFRVQCHAGASRHRLLLRMTICLVEVGGANDNAIVAFNKETGDRIWGVATSPSSYSSPILVTVNGVRQALFFARDGTARRFARRWKCVLALSVAWWTKQ